MIFQNKKVGEITPGVASTRNDTVGINTRRLIVILRHPARANAESIILGAVDEHEAIFVTEEDGAARDLINGTVATATAERSLAWVLL